VRVRMGIAFRRLWVANAFGYVADGVAFVTIPLVAILLTQNRCSLQVCQPPMNYRGCW
jgi:hypothetical protein